MLVQAVSRFSVLCCVSVGGIVCAPPEWHTWIGCPGSFVTVVYASVQGSYDVTLI